MCFLWLKIRVCHPKVRSSSLSRCFGHNMIAGYKMSFEWDAGNQVLRLFILGNRDIGLTHISYVTGLIHFLRKRLMTGRQQLSCHFERLVRCPRWWTWCDFLHRQSLSCSIWQMCGSFLTTIVSEASRSHQSHLKLSIYPEDSKSQAQRRLSWM